MEASVISILLSCCLCLLCIVVLAIVIVVIVMAMRKRQPATPAPMPSSQPSPEVFSEAPVIEESIAAETPETAEQQVVEPVEEPAAPSEPVEPYAAQTIIGSAPIIADPLPEKTVEIPPIPGSIGASSLEVGFDVRELYMLGFTEEEMRKFSKEEIQGVIDGRFSLAELRKSYLD